MKKYILAFALMFVSAFSFAAEPLHCNGLKVATGPKDKGYSNLFRDIKDVTGIQLCEINSAGALQNLDLLAGNKSDIALTQLDMLKQRSGDENISNLEVVMPVSMQFLHILTNANGYIIKGEKSWGGFKKEPDQIVRISKLTDLKGKTVALVGSAQAWGSRINREMGLNFNPVFIDGDKADAQAFEMVRTGKAHAVMTALAWSPNGTIGKLKQEQGFALVNYDGTVAPPYIVKNLTYSNIGQYNVPVLGVQNVLVTRPFKGSKASQVAALKSAIAKNLVELQEGSYEPGWKEIKNIDANVDWAKFQSK